MSSKELIAKARRYAKKKRGAGWLDMADQVDRLADALEAAEGLAYRTRDAWQAAEAKLDEVRKIHKGPIYFHPDLTHAEPHNKCDGCVPLCECAEVYPCPTIQALGEDEHE